MPAAPRIRIVSWNIQFGVAVASAVELLRDHPDLRDADALLLQEMDRPGVERIAHELRMHWSYESACVHPKSGRDFGNAVLTRGAQYEPRVVELPHRSRWQGTPRVAVGTRTVVDGTELGLWSVHTEVPTLGPRKRRDQFRTTAAAAIRHSPARMVVGGDFNTATARSVAALSDVMSAADSVRVSADAGHSLVRARRRLTLDHLFARGLTPLSSGAVDAAGASDHRALWAELRVAEPSEVPTG